MSIDKDSIKKSITLSKVKDYTYTIFFFLTFSFFIVFVIRPNLVNVFSLQEELGRLKILDKDYENVIRKIIDIQSFLELNRDDLYVLDQALPEGPHITMLLDDLQKVASESGLDVNQIELGRVDLKHDSVIQKRNTVKISITTNSNFNSALSYIKLITQQRRLKNIEKINLMKDEKEGSDSGSLQIQFEISGYYL